MVQLISRNKEKGTAQIIVMEKGVSTTLHLRKKRGFPEIFKAEDTILSSEDENGESVRDVFPGKEFDLMGLWPLIDTPSRPTNLTKGMGKKKVSTPKKTREQKGAEKDTAKKPIKKGARGQ